MAVVLYVLALALAAGGGWALFSGEDLGVTIAQGIAGTIAVTGAVVTIGLATIVGKLNRIRSDLKELSLGGRETQSMAAFPPLHEPSAAVPNMGFSENLTNEEPLKPSFPASPVPPVKTGKGWDAEIPPLASAPSIEKMPLTEEPQTASAPWMNETQVVAEVEPRRETQTSWEIVPASEPRQENDGNEEAVIPSEHIETPFSAPVEDVVASTETEGGTVADEEYATETTLSDEETHDEKPIQGRYEAGGNSYVLYVDGSILVETPKGKLHFSSMDEMKASIAARARSGSDDDQ